MSILYALDPGTEQSALVTIYPAGDVSGFIEGNDALLQYLRSRAALATTAQHLVIEQIASYGMPVGAEVFDTCVWTGRFIEAWARQPQASWSLLPRKTVKLALCGSARAKDANIRQALLDRYGGKEKAIGKKASPGPLYGIKSHLWASLALAVAYQETER